MDKKRVLHFLDKYKYVLVLTLFALDMVCFDENSLICRYNHRKQIMELRTQIADYKRQYDRDTRMLHLLETDHRQIERVARERYYMKAPDEDLYVIRPHGSQGPTNTASAE